MRTQTKAEERRRQATELQAQVSAEVGHEVSEATAAIIRRAQNAVRTRNVAKPHLIEDRPLDLAEDTVLVPIGTLIAQVEDYKIVRGVTVTLSLSTSMEFRHLLADAAAISRSDLLVCALFSIPRDHGLPDEDDDDAESAR